MAGIPFGIAVCLVVLGAKLSVSAMSDDPKLASQLPFIATPSSEQSRLLEDKRTETLESPPQSSSNPLLSTALSATSRSGPLSPIDLLRWPLSPSTTAYAPLPFPVRGTCTQGTSYTVNSIQDLYDLVPEIECVWTQAIVPNKVPMGACYGRLLTFANTAFIDYFIEFIYQGDYLLQTQCNGKYYNIGVLNFAGLDLSTGIWSISSIPDRFTFLDGEHYDGREGVLMDFTVNVEHYCPYEGKEKSWGAPRLSGLSPFKTGTWPYRLFIDMLRAVGRDTDNCLILLGRTWMLDPMPPTNPLYTVLYFTLKTCDPEVLPEFTRNTPLEPIAATFRYERQGVFEFLQRLEPLGFFLGDLAGTNPNGIYDYRTHANDDNQPSAGGGNSPGGSAYASSQENSDPHEAVKRFDKDEHWAKLWPSGAGRTFKELVSAVTRFYQQEQS